MKPTGWAIVVLSALLAVAVVVIVAGISAKDRALVDAKAKTEAALAENAILKTTNATLEKNNAELAKNNAAKDKEVKTSAVVIARQKAEIADLKGSVGGAVHVADVAVEQGADAKAVYEAGAPVVEQIAVPALSTWYGLLGEKLTPVFESNISLQAEVRALVPKVDALEADNLELLASNVRLQGLVDSDAIVISDQAGTLATQKATIDAQDVALLDAKKDIDKALALGKLSKAIAVSCGIATVVLGGAVAGQLAGWWTIPSIK